MVTQVIAFVFKSELMVIYRHGSKIPLFMIISFHFYLIKDKARNGQGWQDTGDFDKTIDQLIKRNSTNTSFVAFFKKSYFYYDGKLPSS